MIPAILIGYVLGSLPSGYLVAQRASGVFAVLAPIPTLIPAAATSCG